MPKNAMTRAARRQVKACPSPRRAITVIRTFLRTIAKLEGAPPRPPARTGEAR